MISFDIKPESSSLSPLETSSTKLEPTLSFSQLLKGIESKGDDKIVQNGSLILVLQTKESQPEASKKTLSVDKLLTLLKNDEPLADENITIEDEDPKPLHTLTTKEVKTLINDAKTYLKNQILNSDAYKKSEIKELPKTLKGLAQLAKRFDIDVSKITLQEINPQKKDIKNSVIKPLPSTLKIKTNEDLLKDTKPLEKILQLSKSLPQKESSKAEPTKALKVDIKDAIKSVPLKEIKKSIKAEPTKELKVDIKESSKTEPIKELKVDIKESIKVENKAQYIAPKIKIKKEVESVTATQAMKLSKVEDSSLKASVVQDITKPLFKAQSSTQNTLEHIIQTKHSKIETKTAKVKADETLKLLLRGEKPAQSNSILTADFSVATAKVIAPSASSEVTKSLESLLHSEESQSSHTASKVELSSTHKSDSFEVKINEAKQMVKYLSHDVKNAIEDYKSPFTRLKVQLNPQNLGEVDLTIVQRGKNLHVNISSNNVAINTLALNANDLKAQLNNNGINNATLNFSNQDSSHSEASQQQQNRQNGRQAQREYNYFENEEQNEEVLSSLEIVVPNYA